MFLLVLLVVFCASLQISLMDVKLLTGKYNYKISLVNSVSYMVIAVVLLLIIYELLKVGKFVILLWSFTFIFAFVFTWLLSKLGLRHFFANAFLTFMSLASMYVLELKLNIESVVTFAILGLYYRNNKFGFPYIKKYLLFRSYYSHPINSSRNLDTCNLTYIGKIDSFPHCKEINVEEYDIHPNTQEDIIDKVQILLDKVGKMGGGILFFPKGKYYFNKDRKHTKFLRIDYSNVTIEGEIDKAGNPLTEFIDCNDHVQESGTRNPWLNPFFIVVGESLERSNIFWGLQFKKKKNILTKSNSMSDPGSDGSILTPMLATQIRNNAYAGEDILEVDSTKSLQGCKYALIGMYNTSSDGNLIKELLNAREIRPEWKTALRAGDEVAPSFQLLIQFEIVDDFHIKLTRPLLRDILLKYQPEVFKVGMLENVTIRNIKVNSKWHGVFRHHSFVLNPLLRFYRCRRSFLT